MRQKRAKAYRKLMSLYCMSFGFRQPYQVLVDSEMCKAITSLKLELVKQLSVVLQGDVKPMITQCCIHELYLQGKTQQTTVDLAKTFERRKCNHREPIAGDECLISVVGEANKHRYVIASQSHPLRARLRDVPGVPLVHVNRSVMVLEPSSDATLLAKDAAEEKALHPTLPETKRLHPPSILPTAAEAPKKKRGPKGPNPLSMKKKKPKPLPPGPALRRDRHVQHHAEGHEQSLGQTRQKRRREDAVSDNVHDVHTQGREEMSNAGHKRKRRRNVDEVEP